MKRKRIEVIRDDDNYSDDSSVVLNRHNENYNPKKSRLDEVISKYDNLTSSDIKKMETITKEIENREISIDKILKLDLSMEDNIWFVEQLNVLSSLEETSKEFYELKSKIYEKYKNVTNPEYYKLKKLKDEYGMKDQTATRILNSTHNDYVKMILYRKYCHAIDSGSSDEFFKVVEWIDNVLQVPTTIKTKFDNMSIEKRLEKFWISVNNHVYGLNPVKEKLLETMCAMLINRKSFGKIITLVGPPGVGKTSIGLSIAEAMDLPFDQVSLSDISDASVLMGHSPTYIGSRSGVFVDILKKNRCLDCVILLDEIDKITIKEEGGDVSSKLLKILDRSQNKRFNDAYMPEIDIDMSNIIFIITANDATKIPSALKDRLDILYINGYNVDEKVNIAKTHIIPRITNDLNFTNEKKVIISDAIIKEIISKLPVTPGVRNLERAITQIIERLAVIMNVNPKHIDLSYTHKMSKPVYPLVITKKHIDTLLSVESLE